MSLESQCDLSIHLTEESKNEISNSITIKTESLYSKAYCKE